MQQYFDRDLAMKALMPALINGTHSAITESHGEADIAVGFVQMRIVVGHWGYNCSKGLGRCWLVYTIISRNCADACWRGSILDEVVHLLLISAGVRRCSSLPFQIARLTHTPRHAGT